MTLFMETTQISAEQTVGEIQKILGLYGAKAILLEYANKEVAAVSFKFEVNEAEIPFHLPCRWESIHKTLMRQMKRPKASVDYEAQAKRVAWRQILRWIQAQLALVETNMVTVEEVFLPYMQVKNGRTLYQAMAEKGFNALEFKGKS